VSVTYAMISDSDLADAVVERLNDLIRDPKVRGDVERLVEERILVGEQTAVHGSIQVQQNAAGDSVLGFLGLLNGVIGVIKDGSLKGWGYVAAVYDGGGRLERFRRADAKPPVLSGSEIRR